MCTEGECSTWSFDETRALEFMERSERVVKEVVRMLAPVNPPFVIAEGASRMVSSINKGVLSTEDLEHIASQPGVLQGIVSLLSLENCEGRQYVALRAFYHLARCRRNMKILVSSSRAVEGLVNLFSRTTNSSTQLSSLRVFSLLSESPEINLELGTTPGIIPSLEHLLQHNMTRKIHKYAHYALSLLYAIKWLSRRERILQSDVETAMLLFSDEKPSAYRRASLVIMLYLKNYDKDETAFASHTRQIAALLHMRG